MSDLPAIAAGLAPCSCSPATDYEIHGHERGCVSYLYRPVLAALQAARAEGQEAVGTPITPEIIEQIFDLGFAWRGAVESPAVRDSRDVMRTTGSQYRRGAEMTSGQMLDEIEKIGRPRLLRLDTGWWAVVTLPSRKGTTLEVASDFGHPTHESTLVQLMARLGEITTPAIANIDAEEA